MSSSTHNLSRFKHKGQMSEAKRTVVFLTLAGGLLDAYTYLARGGVFANAETGNIVLMSIAAFNLDWAGAARYFVPILFFALGVPVASIIRKLCNNISHLHWRQVVLAIEIAALFAVGFLPEELNTLANSVVGLICSMQVQTFRKVDGHPFASTMCTGNLRSGMDALYGFFQSHNSAALYTSLHYFGVIFVFGCGAGLGNLLVPKLDLKAIWISCVLLLISFALMFINDEIEELAQEVEELEEELSKETACPDASVAKEGHSAKDFSKGSKCK